jgi:hypothetical protein
VTWRLAPAGGLTARRATALRAAAGGGAVLAGLLAAWAAAALAGPAGLASSPQMASVRLLGGLAVLLAAANGYSKAYSP